MRPQGPIVPSHARRQASSAGGPGAEASGRNEPTLTDEEVLAQARKHVAFPNLAAVVEGELGQEERTMLSRAERRAARRAFRRDLRQARRRAREARREDGRASREQHVRYKSVSRQLKERDRELSTRTQERRRRRRDATDVFGAIGYERMFADGLCEVEEGLYSETVEFSDVSYQSADEEAQRHVFAALSQLIDYFDSDTMLQYSVSNIPVPADQIGRRVFFDEVAAGENGQLAREFNQVLNAKLLEGCSNIRRVRHLTYATAATDPTHAARLLARMRAQVRAQLAACNSTTHLLDGRERLALVAGLLRPGKPFSFSYEHDLSARSPLTTKDFVCPTALDFAPLGDDTCFRAEDVWCQVLVVRPNLASELSDRAVSALADLDLPLVVTWHLQPIDKAKALAIVRRQAAWIQKEVVDNQRRALAQGYDYRILPPELTDTLAENEKVLGQISHANQRLYYFCGLVYTWAESRASLDEQVIAIIRTAHAQGIELACLPLRQREGLNSVLPLGHNHVEVVRDLTTTEACVLVPFTTQELDMASGGYYGQNRLSGNLVVCNRKRLMSPHGFVCGMSGSGKSFAVKREIVNTILANPSDEVFVMDPTGEYGYLVRGCHGTEVVLGPDAGTHLNPLDVCADGLTWEAALAWKIDALLAMTSALKTEGGSDLTQEERSLVTRAVERTYRQAKAGTPLLSDFVASLRAHEGAGADLADNLALVFDRYVSGPLGFLDHPSDVSLGTARLTSFDTSSVPADMRTFCMLANLESVRQRMLANHERGVATWLYIDEVQSLFAHPAIIAYLARLWREGRKFGLICTGMTQSAAAMGAGGDAATIVDQSGFLLLMRQSDADRTFWVRSRSLSAQESEYVSESARAGQGLLIADAVRVPVTDDFPRETALYDMFSTSPEDYARRVRRGC